MVCKRSLSQSFRHQPTSCARNHKFVSAPSLSQPSTTATDKLPTTLCLLSQSAIPAEANGRSLFYDLDWASASDLSLFTDASGRLGFRAVFGSQWFLGEWTQDTVSCSIHWQELFTIFAALLAWGSQWRGKRVLFQCDNEGVVSSLNNGRCADSESLVLLRHISFLCCLNDCWVGAEHLPGHSNVLADALSRLQVQKFQQLCPQAAPSPTPIPAVAMRPWLLSYNDYRKLVSPPQPDAPTLAVKPLT